MVLGSVCKTPVSFGNKLNNNWEICKTPVSFITIRTINKQKTNMICKLHQTLPHKPPNYSVLFSHRVMFDLNCPIICLTLFGSRWGSFWASFGGIVPASPSANITIYYHCIRIIVSMLNALGSHIHLKTSRGKTQPCLIRHSYVPGRFSLTEGLKIVHPYAI